MLNYLLVTLGTTLRVSARCAALRYIALCSAFSESPCNSNLTKPQLFLFLEVPRGK